MLALACAGFAGGWWASQRWASSQALPDVQPSVVYVPAVASGATMPDVRGLDQDDAMQVLADNGWDVSAVDVVTESFAGAEGVVIEQSPVFGTTDVSTIVLTVSQAARVPDPAGRSASDVTTELRNLGANVVLAYAYDPAVPAGQVVAIEPGPGELLPLDITLTVGESGTATFLSDVQCPERCLSSTKDLLLDGKTYASSVTGQASTGSSPSTNVYLLGRHADVFEARLGIPDTAKDTTSQVMVRFIGDGVELFSATAAYGKTSDVRFGVSGVLRLEIVTSVVGAADSYGSQTFGLGDARVVGSDQAIAELRR